MPSPPTRFECIAERILALKDIIAHSGTIVATWPWPGEQRYEPYYWACDWRRAEAVRRYEASCGWQPPCAHQRAGQPVVEQRQPQSVVF